MMSSLYPRSKATFRHNYKHFFITIQKSQKKDYVDHNELYMARSELQSRLPSMEVYKEILELGSKYKQLHLHLLIRISEYIYFKNFVDILGFRLYWRPIYDINGINHYLNKDTAKYTQYDIKNLNFYNHNYGFI